MSCAKNIITKISSPRELSPATIEKLRRFAELLADANGRARLTGPSTSSEIYDLLIEDTLYGLSLFEGARRVVDVGTGGGVPGVILACCMPDTEIVMIDSIKKKTDAVASIIKALDLANASVICGRSEDLASSSRESFDVATARAVAPSTILSELLSPLVRVGGRVIAFKGSSAEEELAPASGKWSKIGLSEPQLFEYEHGEKNLRLVVWKKIARSPHWLPRKAGDAKKISWCDLDIAPRARAAAPSSKVRRRSR